MLETILKIIGLATGIAGLVALKSKHPKPYRIVSYAVLIVVWVAFVLFCLGSTAYTTYRSGNLVWFGQLFGSIVVLSILLLVIQNISSISRIINWLDEWLEKRRRNLPEIPPPQVDAEGNNLDAVRQLQIAAKTLDRIASNIIDQQKGVSS